MKLCGDGTRKPAFQVALTLCACGVALAPFAGQPPAEATPGTTAARLELVPSPAPTLPPLRVVRDPFVRVDVSPDDADVSGGGAPDFVLPPNDGAFAGGADIAVRAVVAGADARALIDAGGATRIVGVGDRIGEAVVRSIRADGIELSNGRFVRLSGGSQ